MLLKSKWFTFLIIAVLGWLSLSFIRIKMQSSLVNKEAKILEDKINNLETANNSIEAYLKHLDQPSFLEREARLKLNYKIEGEGVAFVYPDTKKISSKSEDFFERFSRLPNYTKWIYYLLGY
ncbi:MAG: septum formation initiator family protein [Candidatus Taylorbacteria bacterium]|nr:septum formation initiator family protein [Candidatus Taylorbacteria bacterium]